MRALPLATPPAPARPHPGHPNRPSHPWAHTPLLTAVLVTLLLLATSCSQPDPRAKPGGKVRAAQRRTTTTPPPSTATAPTTPPTPEDKVEAAYLAADRVYFAVLAHPDPDDPRLAATRAAGSLEGVRDVMRMYRAAGHAARFPNGRIPSSSVRMVKVHTQTAVLSTCVVDDSVKTKVEGEVPLDDDIVSSEEAVLMKFIQGRWRVTSQAVTRSWPDGEGCNR